MTTQNRSIGDLITVRRAAANTAATAAGTGDNTAVTGVIIDRNAIGNPQSAVLAIPFTATLAAAATLSIAYTVQEGQEDDLGDAETLQSAASAVVATGPSGGGTVTGTFEVNVPLMGAGRYVRANFTPDLSAGGIDTAALSAVLVFGGADRLPV
ncbi:MAG: hypothetical protein VR71_02145 [Roseovarius sp. BRH_c41]|uniref:hypothetical protein n=1 Tax=Roseovarius sp. BRH_c41 TaxID=1629709 RepID=UPI0005F20715|nr:hypothetical protein [Roseovarius sp. BRH_c41]KJS45236.1 MAG: hypothetical protein VR71_02145 [Roseovarius sp. BRH_c41]